MYVIVNKDFTSVLTEINRFYSIKYLSHRYNVKVFNSRYRAWRDMIRQVLSPDPFRGYDGKIVKFDDYQKRSLELKAGDFAVQFVETFYDNHRRFRVEMTGDSLLGSPGKIRRLKVTDKASGAVIDISYSEDLDGNFVVLDGPGFLTKEGCKYIRYSIVYYVLGRDSKANQLLYRRREARMRKALFK